MRREQESGDPVVWLQKHLCVRFPDDAELMEVSIAMDDPDAATLIVREVVQAYLREVVDNEFDRKRARLSEVDKAVSEKEQDIRTSRESLKKLASELGTSATENLTLKQKMALEELVLFRQELVKLQSEKRHAETALAVEKTALVVTDAEVEAIMSQADRELFAELKKLHGDGEAQATSPTSKPSKPKSLPERPTGLPDGPGVPGLPALPDGPGGAS